MSVSAIMQRGPQTETKKKGKIIFCDLPIYFWDAIFKNCRKMGFNLTGKIF
jgi:hypothetical protein